jgi:hypothetical protein
VPGVNAPAPKAPTKVRVNLLVTQINHQLRKYHRNTARIDTNRPPLVRNLIDQVPLAPKLETTKPKEIGPKPAVEKTNPLLPEVQLAKKGSEVAKSTEKTSSKKSSKSSAKPAPVKKSQAAKKSQGAKKSSPKKRGKKSESSPLAPLVYLGLFYLAYSFITDDE